MEDANKRSGKMKLLFSELILALDRCTRHGNSDAVCVCLWVSLEAAASSRHRGARVDLRTYCSGLSGWQQPAEGRL